MIEQKTPFLADLGAAVQGIPSEMVKQWKDAHRWDRDTLMDFEVVSDEITPDGGRTVTLIREEDPDYVLWKRLGVATYALLALILFLIVAPFVL